MARSNPFRKGWGEADKEIDKQEKIAEQRKGAMWRMYLKDDEEATVNFLTEEPAIFYEHEFMIQGKPVQYTCTEDDECVHCNEGDKPRLKGAWLVLDGREFEVKDKDSNGKLTGKTKTVNISVKLFVRGQKDIARLKKKSLKVGLTKTTWVMSKSGSGTSTVYDLEAEETFKLTPKIEQEIRAVLADKYKKLSFDDIVDVALGGEAPEPKIDKKAFKDKINKQIVEEDDDEDEVVPVKKAGIPRKIAKK